ncbi:MAG TPA: amino acid adenylation domain-containing protein [Acidobacteriota bacterium]|nr:amino acid adenylation domain-containing protein [Acidobacteriota bacterium]
MTALFAHLKTALPAVRGVIHSAGVATDELIATMKPASLEAATASKVAGTLLLHEMTAGTELDFFVLYSSIAAVFGSSGQANYAAANAFEDAFAHFRRTHGLTALSINWGPWDEIGMAADHHHVGMFERVGIQSFSPRDGVSTLDVLLTGPATQKMVANIAWETFRAFYDAFTPHPLLFDLEVIAEPALPPPAPAIEPPVEPVPAPTTTAAPEVVEIKLPENASLEAQLKHASLELQHHLMVTYLQDRISESLHTSRELIEPDRNLIELGLDSIIVTDLMMHFKQDLQFPIFPAEIFRQPSVNAMATYLIGEFNRRHNLPSEPPPAIIVPSVEPAVAARLKQEQEIARQVQPRERIPNVILVLSSPRSGSTLFRVMLSKHSHLFSPPELHLLPYQTMSERDRLLRSSGLDKGLIHAFNKLPGKTPAGVSQLIADLIAQNATTEELYWMLTDQIAPRLLVDKTPSYAASMAVLERAEEIFDQPKYIHLMRHPYAVIESCVRNRFEVLFADLMQATAQDPLTLAEQVWTVTNSNILDFFSRIPAERRQSVRYEDMVVNPTHIMEQMCSFLNIPFEAETVRPYDGKPQSEGKGWQHEGIGDPNFFEHNAIDPGLGDVWKTIRLPRRLGGLARRVAEELGYELPNEPGLRAQGLGLKESGLGLGAEEIGLRVQENEPPASRTPKEQHNGSLGEAALSALPGIDPHLDSAPAGAGMTNALSGQKEKEGDETWGAKPPQATTLATSLRCDQNSDSETLAPELHPLALAPVSRDQKLPLSPLQQMFWMLDKLKPASSFDHAPMNVTYNRRFRGQFKVEVLERCFSEIIRRHEALRTTFVAVDGQPVQIIHPASEFRFALLDQVPADFRLKPVNDNVNILVDLSNLPATEHAHAIEAIVTSEAQRLFDISVGPLLRVVVLRLSPEDHVLLLNIHHIVSDGWSVNVLIQELSALYNAFGAGQPSPLPALPIQYADFACWQQQWIAEHKLDDGIKYWKDQLTGAPPLLTLPTDFPRPAVQSFRGARETIEIPQEMYAALKGLSQSQGATLFMTVLAAFQTLLSKYARQEDIVVGTPIANRDLFETKRLIGFFTNVLALRTDVSGDPTFAELLGRVREMTIAAFTHQNVPFQKVIEAVQPQRDLSYPPIFQVMLVLQNTVKQAISLENLTVEIIDADTGTARNDLTFELLDIGNRISGVVEYNTSLFTAGTIQRMISQFHALLEHIIEDPNRPLSGLSLLSSQEVNLLAQWNQTETAYPRHLKAHELFETQTRQNPDATALVYAEKDEAGRFKEIRLTYAEVNTRAEQLAHYLRDQDVTPYTRVGLCLAPSVELLVGMLAILKAGGAFVPLDPAYPQTRLEFMIRDARLPVILTHSTLVETLPAQTAQILCLDQLQLPAYTTPIEQVKQPAASPVYVIYTSGSTGMPKGVAIKHQSVVNLACALAPKFGLTPADRVLQFASLSFDTAIEEIFPTLQAGATLVCVKDVRMSSAVELLETITATGITVLDLPTAYWHLLVREMVKGKLPVPPSLRLVILGGEQASNEVLDLWFGLVGDRVRLINTYGPTEATVSATLYEARPDQKLTSKVPIGRPIANTQVLVLDQHLKPVPTGVPGELFIGGDGVAIGYLNRKDLTEDRFVIRAQGLGLGAEDRAQGSQSRAEGSGLRAEDRAQGFQSSMISTLQPSALSPKPDVFSPKPQISNPQPSAPSPMSSALSPRFYQTGDLVRWLADGIWSFWDGWTIRSKFVAIGSNPVKLKRYWRRIPTLPR